MPRTIRQGEQDVEHGRRQWRLTEGRGTYAVTGAPVVADDLATALSDSILRLLAVALVVMALTLGNPTRRPSLRKCMVR